MSLIMQDTALHPEENKRVTTEDKGSASYEVGISDICLAGFAELLNTIDQAGISDVILSS